MIKEKPLQKKAVRYAEGVSRALAGKRLMQWSEVTKLIEAAYFNGFQSGICWQKEKRVDLSKGDTTALVRALLRALEHTPARERAAHKRVYDRISEFIAVHRPAKVRRSVAAAMDRASGR